MFSKKLIQGVLSESRHFPKHAVDVAKSARDVLPFEKYTYGEHRRQYLCWFDAVQEKEKKPIIIFFHGGSWTFGKPELFTNRARVLTSQGYPVIMPTHRRLPIYSYKSIREDLIAILKQTKELMEEKEMQHRDIILGGMSSGGNLAALTFFDKSIAIDAQLKEERLIAGFFCGAPLYLEGMPNSIILHWYAGKRYSPTFHQASPNYHLSSSHDKPVLIIHGTNDGFVPYRSTQAFSNRLKEITSADLNFHTIPYGTHLDAISWSSQNNEIRKNMLKWLHDVSSNKKSALLLG